MFERRRSSATPQRPSAVAAARPRSPQAPLEQRDPTCPSAAAAVGGGRATCRRASSAARPRRHIFIRLFYTVLCS
uniref:Uncharacterized protein n=1 Tax=Arundo donax TaxID=35708 RepID=A0A0A9TSF0_ARUDO